jgi:hypothetical protein
MIFVASSLPPNEASNICNEKTQRRDGGTGRAPGLALEWPTNAGDYHVQYAINLLSPIVWQRFSGNPATNGVNFQQAIGQPVGSAACRVRPKAFYVACRVRRSLLRGIFPPVNRQSLTQPAPFDSMFSVRCSMFDVPLFIWP